MPAAPPVLTQTKKRGRPRDPEIDRRIIGETARQLELYGYAKLSIDRVATGAGVSKPTIYRRWPTKDVLVADTFKVTGDPRLDELPDGLEGFKQAYRTLIIALHGTFGGIWPQIVAAAAADPDLRESLSELRELYFAVLAEKLCQAQQDGDLILTVDHRLAVDMLAGIAFHRAAVNELLTVKDGETLIEIFCKGFAPTA